MRILYVIPNVPSRIRTRPFNFITRLSRYHEVRVLCLATSTSDNEFVSELRQSCEDVEVIKLAKWRSLWNCVLAVFSSRPLRCAYFYSPYLRRRVSETVKSGKVDLIHLEHLKSVPMVKDVAGQIATVFDAVDCISLFEARRGKVIRNPVLKLFSRAERRKMVASEKSACELFDRVVISSPIDKECYPTFSRGHDKIEVVPNGVDLAHFSFRGFKAQRDSIIFCAKLDYFANADAALYFTRMIWPLVLAKRPGLHLQIVGSNPSRAIRQLNGKNNVCVNGSVPDVRPFLGSAWVALCPIRVRAGIQFKILEAMAMGVPVVASRLSCPGLEVEPGKHLLVADSPREYVDAIELLLEDDKVREAIITAGRRYVECRHDWENCARALSEVYACVARDAKTLNSEPLHVL